MGMTAALLLTVRTVESWTGAGRAAAVLLIAATVAAVIAWSRRVLGRRAGQITAIVLVSVTMVGLVFWAVVRVIDRT
jgi:hypothetical protein